MVGLLVFTMNNIYPLGVTTPDWVFLKQMFADLTGFNVRCPEDLTNYIGLMRMDNAPTTASWSANIAEMTHVSATFGFSVDSVIMESIVSFKLNIRMTQLGDGKYLIIASGSLDVWLQACLAACKYHQRRDLRELFNKVIIYFDNIGLAQVLKRFKKKPAKDGTFILNE